MDDFDQGDQTLADGSTAEAVSSAIDTLEGQQQQGDQQQGQQGDQQQQQLSQQELAEQSFEREEAAAAERARERVAQQGDQQGQQGQQGDQQQGQQGDQQQGDQQGQQGDAIQAPTEWPVAEQEEFAKLAPSSQQWFLERVRGMEAAHTQRSQELAQRTQELLPVQQAIAPYIDYLQGLGAQPGPAVQQMLGMHYALNTGTAAQKYAIIEQLVRDFGVQAPDQEGQQGQQQQGPVHDPRVDQLAQYVQNMQAQQQSVEHQQYQARLDGWNRAIHAFATATGEDGQPSHPYYGEVQGKMTELAQAAAQRGEQPALEDLYESACWATPAIRQRLMAEQANQDAATRQQEAQRKRQASSTIAGAGSAGKEQPMNVYDTVNSAWNQLAAR